MKKIIVILFCLLMFSGCSKEEEAAGIAEYFPVKANTYYEYECTDPDRPVNAMYILHENGNKFQRWLPNVGSEATEVLIHENNELRVIYGETNCNYYYDLTKTNETNMDYLVLKEPFQKGNSWTLMGDDKCEITSMDTQIETPYGTFTTMEITTIVAAGFLQKDYYAKGVGLVKSMYTNTSGVTVESYLKDIVENKEIQVPHSFYYPDITTEATLEETKNIPLRTNFDFITTLESLLKEVPSEDIQPLLSKDTKINNLSINTDNPNLYILSIDFSKEFLQINNVGSGVEAMLLQCLTDTLGYMHNVNAVEITIENEPYTSGHIEKAPGEYFEVTKRF